MTDQILKDDFFTDKFDERKPEDYMSKLRETSSQNELPENLNPIPATAQKTVNRISMDDIASTLEHKPDVVEVIEEVKGQD